jgi:hypothetical protein
VLQIVVGSMRMAKVNTLSPISHRRTLEFHVVLHAVATVTARRARGAHTLAAPHEPWAVAVGQLAGSQPSRPLWPWAAVRPSE